MRLRFFSTRPTAAPMTDSQLLLRLISSHPSIASTRFVHFLESRIAEVRNRVNGIPLRKFRQDKQFREHDPVWGDIVRSVLDTYTTLCVPEIMAFAMDDPERSSKIVEWVCLTGRQPTMWKHAFQLLPATTQERFLRQLMYECGRLTRHLLLWMDRDVLSRTVYRVFEEFVGRAQSKPIVLPDSYKRMCHRAVQLSGVTTSGDRQALWRRCTQEYIGMVDRNIHTVARFLKLVGRRAGVAKTYRVEVQEAKKRVHEPIVTLNTTYLKAVPTATLESIYSIPDPSERLCAIDIVRTFQIGLATKKKTHAKKLARSDYFRT